MSICPSIHIACPFLNQSSLTPFYTNPPASTLTLPSTTLPSLFKLFPSTKFTKITPIMLFLYNCPIILLSTSSSLICSYYPLVHTLLQLLVLPLPIPSLQTLHSPVLLHFYPPTFLPLLSTNHPFTFYPPTLPASILPSTSNLLPPSSNKDHIHWGERRGVNSRFLLELRKCYTRSV